LRPPAARLVDFRLFALRRRLGLFGLFAVLAAGCAGTRPAVKSDLLAAPLDPAFPALAPLVARSYWMPDEEFGGKVYVVVVDPPGPAPRSTLVLVHGLGTAGIRDFYPVLGDLSRGRRVVTFDLPGFGRSVGANERYTPARYAVVVSRIIHRFGVGPVDVLGHSMGGAIALMHASAYPEQVHRLVLVDAAGILHREAWFGHHLRRVTDPVGALFPTAVDELNQVSNALFSTTRILAPLPAIVLLTPALRLELLDGNPGRIAALSLILTDFSTAISNVVAPTLIVWGSEDKVAPLRTGQLLADRLRDARFTMLAGVGHDVMEEAPTRLVAAVEPFLAAPTLPPLPPAPVEISHGNVSCSGQNDLHLTGAYDDVVLEGCDRATFDHATMKHLTLRNSTARLLHSSVASGIVLTTSHLLATGGRLAGDVALELTDSDVDLAGVAIDARRAVYRLAGTSKAIFSVCPVRAGQATHYLHDVLDSSGKVVESGAP
jgi:pimeloyl-ACP methyl ester carboxylesterase